jgi:hypothetical protein
LGAVPAEGGASCAGSSPQFRRCTRPPASGFGDAHACATGGFSADFAPAPAAFASRRAFHHS